jgi:hypothetical protein
VGEIKQENKEVGGPLLKRIFVYQNVLLEHT